MHSLFLNNTAFMRIPAYSRDESVILLNGMNARGRIALCRRHRSVTERDTAVSLPGVGGQDNRWAVGIGLGCWIHKPLCHHSNMASLSITAA